jgi:hypothetical protein
MEPARDARLETHVEDTDPRVLKHRPVVRLLLHRDDQLRQACGAGRHQDEDEISTLRIAHYLVRRFGLAAFAASLNVIFFALGLPPTVRLMWAGVGAWPKRTPA